MKQDRLLTLAWQIVDRLEEAGHHAYLVGGFVRDSLLGRPIKDIDIATSALPQTVIALFERVEPTGLQHGTVTVIVEAVPFEVTTFRSESGYSDKRRPDAVAFITDIRDDLSRRDFTMNAMAMDRRMQLVDPFGGQDDLRAKRLRCVGAPDQRFAEDALRMLRCVRFAAEYALAIDDATWHALLQQADAIKAVAIERVRAELERIIEGSFPERGIALLASSGLAKKCGVPFIAAISGGDESERLRQLAEVRSATEDPIIRWAGALLVLGMSAVEAVHWLRSLTFSNRKRDDIVALLRWEEEYSHLIGDGLDERKRSWKLLVLKYGKKAARRWLVLARLVDKHREELVTLGEQWLSEMPVDRLAALAISGEQLITAGIPAGPQLGSLLHQLLHKAALGDIPNDKESLLSEAIRLWHSQGEEQ